MNNKILKVLALLTQDDITAFTTHSFFRRGLEYFTYGKVIRFAWLKDDTELVALIHGSSKNYQVKIKYDDTDDELKSFCDCPAWNPYNYCKHLICTLLTASHVLNNEVLSDDTLLRLKMELLKSDSGNLGVSENNNELEKSTLSLHLRYPKYDFLVSSGSYEIALFEGDKEIKFQAGMLPDFYQKFLYKTSDANKRIVLFQEALKKKEITLPLVVHTGGEEIQVLYEPNQAEPFTELNYREDYVEIRCLATLKGHREPLQNLLTIGNDLLVDTVQKKLMGIKGNARWNWAQQIDHHVQRKDASDFCAISEPFVISIETFNDDFSLYLTDKKSAQKRFVFKQDGKRVQPLLVQPQLIIDGRINIQKNSVHLSPQIFIDGVFVQLDMLLNYYITRNPLPSWLMTKGRNARLNQALFALIGMRDPDDVKNYINSVKEELCKDYKGYDSGSVVTKFLQGFYDGLLKTVYDQVMIVHQQFCRVTIDHHSLWRSYSILSRFFGDCYQWESMYQSHFTVPVGRFFDSLAELEKVARDHQIALRVNSKQIKISALDIEVDVSHGSSGDWFQVAPELSSQGVPLTRDQRELIFGDTDRVLETAHEIMVLDVQTREMMKLLKKIFSSQGSTSAVAQQEVVQLPRLKILDLLELRKGGARITLSSEDEKLLDGLNNFKKIEKIQVPKKFTGQLRDYQRTGYQWLAFLYKNRFGACLADDMGLGKTIQAIVFLGGIAEGIIENRCTQKVPHLIVVPPTLLFNWQHELQTFYPALRVKVYAGAARTRSFEECDIVLTTYDIVRIDREYFKTGLFHVLILDEAQTIKNIHSARTAAVRELKSIFTLSLTGTPLENHIGEYYSIIDVALPGLLPDYNTFMKGARQEEHENFIRKMNVFVLRRTKDAILTELPPKIESNVMLAMTERQQKVYATTVAEVKRSIEQAYTTKTGPQANIVALTALLRLRQICISPQLIDKKSFDDAPKVDYLVQSLSELIQEGAAALVFSQFIGCLDLIEKALVAAGLTYYRIDGSIPVIQRKKIIESFQFNRDGISILLLSLKTGGVGLNLTRANYVFHVDPWWNPAVENQASDRAHRMGQRNTVFITRLVMHQSIEEKMMGLKAAKQKLFQDVMEHAENKKSSLMTKKDFDLLLE